MHFLTIGSCTRDIFLQQNRPLLLPITQDHETRFYYAFEKGTKHDLEGIIYGFGGAASNTAVTFAKSDHQVTIWSITGNDFAGDEIIANLERYHIKCSYLKRSPLLATTSSYIFTFPDGDRTILTDRAAQNDLRLDVEDQLLKTIDTIYISSLPTTAHHQLPELIERCKAVQCAVAINPGAYQLNGGFHTLKKALSGITYLMCNKREAGILHGHLAGTQQEGWEHPVRSKTFKDVYSDFIQRLREIGISYCAVTCGNEGAVVSDSTATWFHEALKGVVTNTVGAGDAFGSMFVMQLATGKDITVALHAALLNSQSVISHIGAQIGILEAGALQEVLQNRFSPEKW